MKKLSVKYGRDHLFFDIPAGVTVEVLSPNNYSPAADAIAEINRALDNPINCDTLENLAMLCSNALIIADDNTRLTPAKDIIPPVLDRLNAAGIDDGSISILIALGTHRPMTEDEIVEKFGAEVVNRVKIINHDFNDPKQLCDMGVTENGTPISVNKLLLEHDFIVGIGSIVPHHIPGFSGGAKIIQPGVCGAETTAKTHLLSVRLRHSMLGIVENEVRSEMELIAKKVNARYVFNAVLDDNGDLIKGFFGDIETAFREGVKLSREVYGVKAFKKADIVIASSYPCDIEFWQAHKTLYACEAVLRDNGTMIIVTPCPEGVSAAHPDILSFTGQRPEDIDEQIKLGIIKDEVAGALALAWANICRRFKVCIVSGGIDRETAEKLGFTHYPTIDTALKDAVSRQGSEADMIVLPSGGDILPVI